MPTPMVIDNHSHYADCLIELMGHTRLIGRVYNAPQGGFYVRLYSATEPDLSDPMYIGPSAIFRMYETSEKVARATAAAFYQTERSAVADWAAEPPPPIPVLSESLIGDNVYLKSAPNVRRSLTDVGTATFILDGREIHALSDWPAIIERHQEIPF